MAYSKKEKNKILGDIFKRLSEGEALRQILDEKEQITRGTFYKWVDESPEEIERYKAARLSREGVIFDEILQIADGEATTITDEYTGEDIVTKGDTQRDRLRVDARKWVLAKMNANKYGDKVTTKHEAADDITELNITIKKTDDKPE